MKDSPETAQTVPIPKPELDPRHSELSARNLMEQVPLNSPGEWTIIVTCAPEKRWPWDGNQNNGWVHISPPLFPDYHLLNWVLAILLLAHFPFVDWSLLAHFPFVDWSKQV